MQPWNWSDAVSPALSEKIRQCSEEQVGPPETQLAPRSKAGHLSNRPSRWFRSAASGIGDQHEQLVPQANPGSFMEFCCEQFSFMIWLSSSNLTRKTGSPSMDLIASLILVVIAALWALSP